MIDGSEKNVTDRLGQYRALERESFKNSDAAIFERFSEDMLLVSNGTPTLQGRDAIQQHFQTVWQTHKTRFVELVDEDLSNFGEILVVSGRFKLAVSEIDSVDEAISEGRYLAVFKLNEHGEYELWREAVTDGGPEDAE